MPLSSLKVDLTMLALTVSLLTALTASVQTVSLLMALIV
jgi:hypothetical protein